MDNFSRDLLKNQQELVVEKFTYQSTTNMYKSHYHDHYEILYVVRGERKLILNNSEEYLLNSDNIALVRPFVVHRTESVGDGNQTRIMINMSQGFVDSLLQNRMKNILSCFDNIVVDINAYACGFVKRSLDELLNNAPSSPFYEEVKIIEALSLLLALSKAGCKQPRQLYTANDNSMNIIRKIIAYLEDHIGEEITLPELAAAFQVSVPYLVKNFKKQTGSTLIRYINNMRVMAAQRLLENKDIRIADVAASTGFSSMTHFERVFKKSCGLSPKVYQRQQRDL